MLAGVTADSRFRLWLRHHLLAALERANHAFQRLFLMKRFFCEDHGEYGPPFGKIGVIDHDAAKDERVGNGYLFSTGNTHPRGAQLYIFDDASACWHASIGDGDNVADVKGMLKQNVEAGHKVFQDVLNGEGESGGEDANRGQRYIKANLPDRENPE